jgi:Arm DNA-binding domain
MHLNAKLVAALVLGNSNDTIFFDDQLPGFGYRLRRKSAVAPVRRSWIIQYRLGGSTRRVKIGDANVISAEVARAASKKKLAMVTLGFDPQAAKREIISLTLKGVTSKINAGKPGRFLDAGPTGVRGLYLVVTGPKSASWQLRYQVDHHPRWMGLGSARDLDLLQAREKAQGYRRQLTDKLDPLEIRRQERATARGTKAAARSNKQQRSEPIPRGRRTRAWKAAFDCLVGLGIPVMKIADEEYKEVDEKYNNNNGR